MCELLVKAVDSPVTDLAAAYKTGDVVVIMPDGHQWGKEELNQSVFNVIKKPGVPIDDVIYLLDDDKQPLNKVLPASLKNNPKLIIQMIQKGKMDRPIKTRKRYKIDLNTKAITDKRFNNVI